MKELFKKSICPKIVLNGWWWKKYIPYYQKQSKVMNDMLMDYWVNKGGCEEFMDLVDKHYTTELLNNGYETIYTPDQDSLQYKGFTMSQGEDNHLKVTKNKA